MTSTKATNAGVRDPAILFYPLDFYSDRLVVVMTLEEQGAYHRLLYYTWISDGHGIPMDFSDMAQAIGVTVRKMKALWRRLEPCFIPHPDFPDRLVNKRQEEERVKRGDFKRKKSEAGQKGAERTNGSERPAQGSANARQTGRQTSGTRVGTATGKRSAKGSAQGAANERLSISNSISKNPPTTLHPSDVTTPVAVEDQRRNGTAGGERSAKGSADGSANARQTGRQTGRQTSGTRVGTATGKRSAKGAAQGSANERHNGRQTSGTNQARAPADGQQDCGEGRTADDLIGDLARGVSRR